MFDLTFKIGASRLRRDGMDRRRKPHSRGTPKLERRNAVKNIEYDASSSSSDLSPTTLRATRSLDLSPSQTSFRIGGGVDGEVDLIYRSLGLSGPEDFAIPAAAWEARKARSGPLTLPPSPLGNHGLQDPSRVEITGDQSRFGDRAAGIRGVRPPVLSPPTPPVSSPVLEDSDNGYGDDDGEEEEEVVVMDRGDGDGEEVRVGETAEDLFECCSCSTSNDDDSSSTTTEAMFVISPNGKFKKRIKPWMKGALLGSGSYGTVYEVIAK